MLKNWVAIIIVKIIKLRINGMHIVEMNSIKESKISNTNAEIVTMINKLENGWFFFKIWNFPFLCVNASTPEKSKTNPKNTTINWAGWNILKRVLYSKKRVKIE